MWASPSTSLVPGVDQGFEVRCLFWTSQLPCERTGVIVPADRPGSRGSGRGGKWPAGSVCPCGPGCLNPVAHRADGVEGCVAGVHVGDSPSLLCVPRRRRPHLLAAAPVLQVTSSPVCVDMSGMSVPTEFLSRHSSDAVITFVDPRCISVIGYQPQVGLPELTAAGGGL